MGSNGISHSYGEPDEGSISIRREEEASCDEPGIQKGSEQRSAVLEISRAEEMNAGSSSHRGEYLMSFSIAQILQPREFWDNITSTIFSYLPFWNWQ